MAEQSTHDVVNQERSGGDASPSDVTATQKSNPSTVGPAENPSNSSTHDSQRQDLSNPLEHTTTFPEPQPNGIATDSESVEDSRADAEGSTREVEEVFTNGGFEGQSEGEEGALQDPQGLASGGSDTDTNKADNLDSVEVGLNRDQGHVRSDSFKKPASFKAVSVTKNFLAKAAAGTTPASKGIGDKSSTTSPGLSGTSSQPVPRPRLVAKSGSGLRDAAPRPTNVSSGIVRGSGPDPNQVWNKNRPVQPPPPKQFTDEELKQQYGIHLATRLQADETGKEAKWADIDDDEDDWAPETIEWNDGTKITLPNPDILAEEQAAAAALQAKRAEAERVKLTTSQHQTSIGPKATILKVGAQPGQPKSGGLVLKGATEKPTLVARPTPPTPVKSPWASLPPVEKVPPIPTNPSQAQQPNPRFSQRDPHGFDSMPPPPSPAKEIAADDFNRSWRDSHTGNRELYNSQSGRYEPVNEGRRGSVRHDQGFRQPSVLQRPSQQDHQGPAEPSAAFQTSRSSGVPDGGRRRTSSNVSGGSGAIGRRVSFSKGQEMPPTTQDPHIQQRRGSQAAGPLQSVLSPRNISPSRQEHQSVQNSPHNHSPAQPNHRHSWHQRASPVLNHTYPASPHTAETSTATSTQSQQGQNQETNASTMQPAENQNPVVMQEQLMRERRELAIKRRKEQEEKDEAEKKERIRLKLEALGMTGPNEVKEKFKSPVVNDSHLKKDDSVTAVAPSRSSENKPQEETKQPPKTKADRAKLLTKITPPTHRATGHAGTSQSNDVSLPLHQAEEPKPSQITNSTPISTAHQPPTKDQIGSSPPDAGTTSLPREKREEQPWKQGAASQDSFATWSNGGMTTHSTTGANLWGTPNNDKALGNGTFPRGYTRLAPRQPSQQQQLPPAPGPIGPPAPSQRASQPHPSPQDSVTNLAQAQNDNGPIGAHQKHSGTSPSPQVSQSEFGQAAQASGGQTFTGGPGPIAPPSGPANRAQQQRAHGVSAWKSFPAQVAREDAAEKQRAAEMHSARLEEEARTGIKRESQQPTFKETWRQVAIDEGAGQRQVVSVLKTSSGGQAVETKPPMIANRQIQPSPVPAAPFSNSVTGSPSVSTRPSRFFPQTGRSVSYGSGYLSSASPPPPDSVTHPAYDGDITRPLVSLPILKPKPIVKLPPTPVAPLASAEGTRAVSQPLLTPPSWQDRFNGLLGRKLSSPPKTSALAVNSSTKAPLDVPPVEVSATVSLPRSEDGESTPIHIAPLIDDTFDVTSKATEETLLEEREFGSLPTVKLPLQAPPKAWQPVRSPHNPRSRSKFQKTVEAESIQPFVFEKKENHGPHGPLGLQISLRLPGSQQTRYRYLRMVPESRHRTPPSNMKRKGMKPRDSSSNIQPPRGNQRPNPTGLLGPPPRQSVQPSPSFGTNPWGRIASVGH